MRRLTIVVLALAAIYSGYWVIGSRTVASGTASAMAQMQADGWQIDTTDVKTRGFPSRFDTTLTELTLAPPDRSWRYTAPFVQALALSYAPNEVIAILPETQTLELPGQTLTIVAEKLRASTGVAASTDLTYQGFTAEGDKLALNSTLNYSIAISRLLAAMRPSAASETSYDLYAELLDISLAEAPDAGASNMIERVSADAVLTLDKTLDRQTFQAIEQDPVLPKALNLKDFTMLWGEVQLSASGDLDIPAGTPEGQVDLTITNWDALIDLLVQSGGLDQEVATTYRNMAGLLSGGTAKLDIPVTLRGGRMSVGPFPLGPAPRFY